jgi:hypothetical protein
VEFFGIYALLGSEKKQMLGAADHAPHQVFIAKLKIFAKPE